MKLVYSILLALFFLGFNSNAQTVNVNWLGTNAADYYIVSATHNFQVWENQYFTNVTSVSYPLQGPHRFFRVFGHADEKSIFSAVFLWEYDDVTFIDHFRLYLSVVPGTFDKYVVVPITALSNTNFIGEIANLTYSTTYYVAATAVSKENVESDFSEMIWFTTPTNRLFFHSELSTWITIDSKLKPR